MTDDQPARKINMKVVEPLLRMAISNYEQAVNRVDVAWKNECGGVETYSDYLLEEAAVSAYDAISFIQEWAELNGVKIRDRMKT